jgi:DNA-binding CsgD family transcriptional regulator
MGKLLAENEAKRLHFPPPLLLCFAMLMAWQTGVIRFSNETFSLDGGTSLPISVGDLTFIVAAGYILSIIWMIFLPRLIVWAQRLTVGAALLSTAAFYLPLSHETLQIIFYFHVFCSIFLLGFENAVITYLFREQTAMWFITLAYALAMLITAVLQNDAFSIPFPVFRIFMVLATALQLFFYCRLPSKVWPRYSTKKDDLICPRYFFIGLFALGAIGFLMSLFGITIAETIPNGESFFYGALSVGLILVFVLWKGLGIPALRIGSVSVVISALGFMLALLSLYVPSLSLLVCFALGCGGIVGLFVPFFCLTLAKIYPSRFISPIMVALCFGAILLHGTLLEAFRDKVQIMYASYLVIAVGLALLYLALEPYLTYSYREKPQDEPDDKVSPEDTSSAMPEVLQSHASERLTAQELRVAELSLRGFSYTEIAKALGLAPNTVKWYQKSLYSKLQINSKRELFAIAEKYSAATKPSEKPEPKRLLLRRQ